MLYIVGTQRNVGMWPVEDLPFGADHVGSPRLTPNDRPGAKPTRLTQRRHSLDHPIHEPSAFPGNYISGFYA